MVYDIVVLKMQCVYSTFLAQTREEAIQVQIRHDKIIKWFLTLYLCFGVFLNIFTYLYFYSSAKDDDVSNGNRKHSTDVTIMGSCLFIIDMIMLYIYYSTTRKILTFVSKDYKINYCATWFIIHVIAFTYIIESVWSDLLVWGSDVNIEEFYVKYEDDLFNFNQIAFSVCTLNSIIVAWI
jgi:heme/copper-type cytochrome/quinol oxidase subunit 2